MNEKQKMAKNPWLKTMPVTKEDIFRSKFGEKLPEQYEDHSSKFKYTHEPATNHKQNVFKIEDDYEDPKAVVFKSKSKKPKKVYEDLKPWEVLPEAMFPPPRAEHKEIGNTKNKDYYDESSMRNPSDDFEEETNNDDPFLKMAQLYLQKYRDGLRGEDNEKHNWKEDQEYSDKKIEVGSTFSFDTVTPQMEYKNKFQTTTPFPYIDVNHEESKKTSDAHDQLLKLMNEFFGESSDFHHPSESSTNHKDREETIETAGHGKKAGDILQGSESVTEEVTELPPELMDVVDFIASQSDDERKESKLNDGSHEVIKINGPITDDHLKHILMEHSEFSGVKHRKKKNRQQPIKKIIVMPPEDSDDMKEIAEIAKFTSFRLEPLLKEMESGRNERTVIPMKQMKPVRRPAVITAKKVPVRVVYKDHLSESRPPKVIIPKPNTNLKVLRSRLPAPSLQVIQNHRVQPNKKFSQPLSGIQPSIVIHPKTLYPPHPPPLQRNRMPYNMGYPMMTGGRPLMRHKRSLLKRDRRQLRYNTPFQQFPRSIFPTFNPRFVPKFTPFKNIFSGKSLKSAGSSLSPFSIPRYPPAKSVVESQPPFQPIQPNPSHVQHVTRNGQQTIIVEEVPIPIHVEVPDSSLLRPVHSGSNQHSVLSGYQAPPFRAPSPPALQTPPLVQRPFSRYPMQSPYRPFGMPSNVSPLLNYHPSFPFSQPHPHAPSIPNPGPVYNFGITDKPFLPSKPPPFRAPNSIAGTPSKPPPSFSPFDVPGAGFSNYQYFPAAFTTPISHEPVAGRLMYSGYKPPKSSLSTQPPRTTSLPKNRGKLPDARVTRYRSNPTPSYLSSSSQEQAGNYRESTRSNSPRTTQRPSFSSDRYSTPTLRQNVNENSPYTDYTVPRRKKPGKRRRPRPSPTPPTPLAHLAKEIPRPSPTPQPLEQIPPPTAEITHKPYHPEVVNALLSAKDSSKNSDFGSTQYPPAGYYGKDQLVKFFDSSSKPYKKEPTGRPRINNNLGETTAGAELDEAVTSLSSEDGDQVAFGTRLRSNSQGQKRKKERQHVQSGTQKTEVRTRAPNPKPEDAPEKSNGLPQHQYRKPQRSQEDREQRNSNTPSQRPRRPRPPPPTPPRQMRPVPSRRPVDHRFRYGEQPTNFYSVPEGLQGFVGPAERPAQGYGGSTDMYGIPHPGMDNGVYSKRPRGTGAPDIFQSSFFSVPPEVARQQLSPLQTMNVKPIPDSARDFFKAAEVESAAKFKEAHAADKKEAEEKERQKASGENADDKTTPNPTVRKLRKPKRKNRYNPRNNGDKQITNNADQETDSRTRELPTTTTVITTPEPPRTTLSTSTTSKDPAPVFKPRQPLLPKSLPEFPKSFLNGLDVKKLNATISTSVSVSGPFQPSVDADSGEETNKRVFSSQNGGLAVMRTSPKRKKNRNKTLSDQITADIDPSSKAKYDIAASVLDIIKATTETEKENGFYSNIYNPGDEVLAASKLSGDWGMRPLATSQKKTESS